MGANKPYFLDIALAVAYIRAASAVRVFRKKFDSKLVEGQRMPEYAHVAHTGGGLREGWASRKAHGGYGIPD